MPFQEPDQRLVRLLATNVHEFNIDATGVRDARELLAVDTSAADELRAGIHGWTWGGTGWIESLWVRG